MFGLNDFVTKQAASLFPGATYSEQLSSLNARLNLLVTRHRTALQNLYDDYAVLLDASPGRERSYSLSKLQMRRLLRHAGIAHNHRDRHAGTANLIALNRANAKQWKGKEIVDWKYQVNTSTSFISKIQNLTATQN